MEKGWIKLSRSILEEPWWNNRRPYDIGKAFVDMVLMAAICDTEVFFNHRKVALKRGQLAFSLRSAANRWNVSHVSVLTFTETLTTKGMIRLTQTETKVTIITICDYDNYAQQKEKDLPPTLTASGGNPCGNPYHINKNKKNTSTTSTTREENEDSEIAEAETTLDHFAELQANAIWVEIAATNLKTDKATICQMVDEFRLHCAARDKAHQTLADCKGHFMDWARIVLKENNKQQRNGTSKTYRGSGRSMEERLDTLQAALQLADNS